MIRRAVFASFVVLMLSTASVLAAAKTVTIKSASFSPAAVTVVMGGSVQWKNSTGKKHSITSSATFLWAPIAVGAHKTSKALVFSQAGTFAYYDSLHAGLSGSVAVPMQANAAVLSVDSYVTLTVGTVPPSGPVWHDVVERLNGGAWVSAGTTESTSTDVKLNSAGTYEFETRLHQALSGGNTGWSPIITVTAQ